MTSGTMISGFTSMVVTLVHLPMLSRGWSITKQGWTLGGVAALPRLQTLLLEGLTRVPRRDVRVAMRRAR